MQTFLQYVKIFKGGNYNTNQHLCCLTQHVRNPCYFLQILQEFAKEEGFSFYVAARKKRSWQRSCGVPVSKTPSGRQLGELKSTPLSIWEVSGTVN